MTASGGHTWKDSIFALLVGGAVGAIAWLSGNSSEIPPELWDRISVAASLRPPLRQFPLLWQNLLSLFVSEFGISRSLAVLKAMGPVSLGLLTVLAFRIFSLCIPEAMRTDMNRTRSGRLTVALVLAQGAVFLVCSEPVWLAGRVFSPEMMNMLVFSVALLLSLTAIDRLSPLCMIFAGALSGALFAETPLALLPAVLCAVSLFRKCGNPSEIPLPLAKALVYAVALRRMAIAFIFCWMGMLFVNLAFYRACGGGGEPDAGVYVAAIKYLCNYFLVAKDALSPTGFLLVVAVVLLPLVIIGAKMRALSDPERLLPMPQACFAALVGMLALSQSTGFYGCRFWDWESEAVNSSFVLCMCMFATSITAVKVLGVFAVEVFFRNHARLLREAFPGADEEDSPAAMVLHSLRRSTMCLRVSARFEPILALALVVPFRFDSAVVEMSSIVNGIARQTALECGDAAMVFTDGSYDAAVEVASARAGGKLKAMSMMVSRGKYEKALRLRGEADEENRMLLEDGSADALRVWVQSGNARATNVAVQVGLELWRNSGLAQPAIGGLVARTAGFREGEALRWSQEAEALSGRILGFCSQNNLERSGYPQLRRFFHFGQWRLSRMCRMRAYEADAKGDAARSEREHALADKLDACNPQWREVRDRMLSLHMQGGVRLTPQEGLKLALKRADFRMAKPFAERILSSDPDDMQANFAIAMGYFVGKRYAQAEKHLEKCLLRSPDEPAVLNNLAVVQLRLGKLDQAETNALKALERFGSSMEVKATLRHIRSARKNAGK